MANVLVLYDSGYGATAEVAKIIARYLADEGVDVDLSLVGLADPARYDAVVIGSPIRLSQCTPAIKQFLKRNHTALLRVQVAFFFTCMSVTRDEPDITFPLYIDAGLSQPDKPHARIRFMEKNHTASYYLKHFLKIIPGLSPVGISFFKGRLNISGLRFFHRMVMRFAMFALPEITEGDYINEAAIQNWAKGLAKNLKSNGQC